MERFLRNCNFRWMGSQRKSFQPESLKMTQETQSHFLSKVKTALIENSQLDRRKKCAIKKTDYTKIDKYQQLWLY